MMFLWNNLYMMGYIIYYIVLWNNYDIYIEIYMGKL